MIEVEVFGASLAPGAPDARDIEALCARVAASRGVHEGHVAIEFVNVRRITELNAAHRDRQAPTDVLSFPIDGVERVPGLAAISAGRPPSAGGPGPTVPRELGDVVICPQHTSDLREAIVHGMLHLLGMDHETDDGEMLARQRELLAGGGE